MDPTQLEVICGLDTYRSLNLERFFSSAVLLTPLRQQHIMFTPFLIFAILVSSCLTSAASLDSSGDSRHEHPKCDFIIKKWTLWDGGMAATLKIPVVKDVESWNVVVSFNKQFQKLSFFNALQNSTEGRAVMNAKLPLK